MNGLSRMHLLNSRPLSLPHKPLEIPGRHARHIFKQPREMIGVLHACLFRGFKGPHPTRNPLRGQPHPLREKETVRRQSVLRGKTFAEEHESYSMVARQGFEVPFLQGV